MQYSLTVALGLLAASATASLPPTVPLQVRQEFDTALQARQAGDPRYDCHEACGLAIQGATGGYCTDAAWLGRLDKCLGCANTFNIWMYYSAKVGAAATACGLDATPRPVGGATTTAAPTVAPTSAAPTSAPPAADPTSTEGGEAKPTSTEGESEAKPTTTGGADVKTTSTEGEEKPSTTDAGKTSATTANATDKSATVKPTTTGSANSKPTSATGSQSGSAPAKPSTTKAGQHDAAATTPCPTSAGSAGSGGKTVGVSVPGGVVTVTACPYKNCTSGGHPAGGAGTTVLTSVTRGSPNPTAPSGSGSTGKVVTAGASSVMLSGGLVLGAAAFALLF